VILLMKKAPVVTRAPRWSGDSARLGKKQDLHGSDGTTERMPGARR
jgi:hypothetical protein